MSKHTSSANSNIQNYGTLVHSLENSPVPFFRHVQDAAVVDGRLDAAIEKFEFVQKSRKEVERVIPLCEGGAMRTHDISEIAKQKVACVLLACGVGVVVVVVRW